MGYTNLMLLNTTDPSGIFVWQDLYSRMIWPINKSHFQSVKHVYFFHTVGYLLAKMYMLFLQLEKLIIHCLNRFKVYGIVKYMHNVGNTSLKHFSLCKTETPHPLTINSPFLPLSALDNHHSTFCFKDFGCFRYLI